MIRYQFNMLVRISLVIPTIHRKEELKKLLQSIASQKDFPFDQLECILVDQNVKGYLDEVLKDSPFKIKHLLIPSKGLSNAKNTGLKEAQGDLILFPDDDCWFSPDFLNKIDQVFKKNPNVSGVFFRATDPVLKKDLVAFPTDFHEIDFASADAFCSPQIAQAYKTEVLKDVNGFDENLGAGAPYFGSGEDTDLALRILSRHHRILLDSTIEIYHPLVDPKSMTPAKALQYGRGFGAVCMKHELYLHWVFKILKQLGAAIYYFLKFDFFLAKQALYIAWGRWTGGISFSSAEGP